MPVPAVKANVSPVASVLPPAVTVLTVSVKAPVTHVLSPLRTDDELAVPDVVASIPAVMDCRLAGVKVRTPVPVFIANEPLPLALAVETDISATCIPPALTPVAVVI